MQISTSPDYGTNSLPLEQTISADGAITIPAVDASVIVITKSASALAGTLAAPATTTDDFKVLTIISNTAQAHVVTTPANKIQDGTSTTKDTATFAAHAGASIVLMAYQGLWNLIAANAVVLTEV